MDTKGYQNGNKAETSGNEVAAYPSIELAAEAIKLGAADYLIMPVGPMI